jgi:hypothetical protein
MKELAMENKELNNEGKDKLLNHLLKVIAKYNPTPPDALEVLAATLGMSMRHMSRDMEAGGAMADENGELVSADMGKEIIFKGLIADILQHSGWNPDKCGVHYIDEQTFKEKVN